MQQGIIATAAAEPKTAPIATAPIIVFPLKFLRPFFLIFNTILLCDKRKGNTHFLMKKQHVIFVKFSIFNVFRNCLIFKKYETYRNNREYTFDYIRVLWYNFILFVLCIEC